MAWTYLVIAGLVECAWAMGLKYTAGYTRCWPSLFTILSSLQDAATKSFGSKMQFGALVAFVVAMTLFSVFGITSAFWAIVAGLFASLLVERSQLIDFWEGRNGLSNR